MSIERFPETTTIYSRGPFDLDDPALQDNFDLMPDIELDDPLIADKIASECALIILKNMWIPACAIALSAFHSVDVGSLFLSCVFATKIGNIIIGPKNTMILSIVGIINGMILASISINMKKR